MIAEVGHALLELLRPHLPDGTALLLVRPGAPTPAPWGAPVAAPTLAPPTSTARTTAPPQPVTQVGAPPLGDTDVGVPVLADGDVGVPRFTDGGPGPGAAPGNGGGPPPATGGGPPPAAVGGPPPATVGVPVLKDREVGVPRLVGDGPRRAGAEPASGTVGVPVLEERNLGVPRLIGAGEASPDAPSLAAPAPGPAVRLALCWLREDPQGRQSGDQDVRDADGSLLGRQAPARRYELRYLVTATAATVQAEHELLDAVLLAVTGLDALPAERLPAALAGTGLPVFLRVCAEPALAAAGIPDCAGFELSVSAPLQPPLRTELAPPAAELAMGVRRPMPQRPQPPAPSGNGRQWRRARVSEE